LVKQSLDLWDEDLDLEEAENGMEALVCLECRDYHLMICDVSMPVLDGFSVLTRARAMESSRNMPIIMLTAEAEPEQILHGFNLGATSYLIKPFNVQDLLDALDAQEANAQATARSVEPV
jgi:DNA-binding response OmpR family regulator